MIRATVDPNATGGGPGSCGTGAGAKAGKDGAAASGASAASGVDDDLVQTCVREVMRILEEKRER